MTNLPSGTVFYFDASALVKRYVAETGSPWTIALCDSSTGNAIATGRITKAEIAAAFARKYRSDDLSQSHYKAALQDLAHHFMHQYFLIEIGQALVDLAVDLTRRQKLRGYDAIQLAAALSLNEVLTQAQLSPLTFIAADNTLLEAAQNEGLTTENPNTYP
jgi:predicted nucleic acid-binding protein